MKKYRLFLSQTLSAEIDVEAESKDSAAEKALAQASEKPFELCCTNVDDVEELDENGEEY